MRKGEKGTEENLEKQHTKKWLSLGSQIMGNNYSLGFPSSEGCFFFLIFLPRNCITCVGNRENESVFNPNRKEMRQPLIYQVAQITKIISNALGGGQGREVGRAEGREREEEGRKGGKKRGRRREREEGRRGR